MIPVKNNKSWKIHSIQIKILMISMLIALGTTIVSLVISYYTEINTIKKTTELYMTQYISFADENFNSMLTEARKISLAVATEQEIILPTMKEPFVEASYDDYQQKKKIRSYLSGLMSQKEYIENIMVVTDNGRIYQANNEPIMKKDLEKSAMRKALETERSGIFYNREEKEVLLGCPIISGGKAVAAVVISLNYDIMVATWQIEPLDAVNIYIYGPLDTLFYTNTVEKGKEAQLLSLVEEVGDNTGYLKWNGEKQYFIRYGADTETMTTISIIPYRLLLQDADKLKWKFLFIGMTAVLFAVAASAYLSGKLCTNLHKLTESMREIQNGNLLVRSDITAVDEIGLLSGAFNEMVERISLLLEEVRQKERLKREAEQDVLAAQIEPHFLYNSIDSIQYVAHMRKEEEIERVAVALSELLRSVLSNRNEFITLWEERVYIENYITIERFKYRGFFQLLWDVDEELWTYRIPKLLLQPIVENALIHGISTRENDGVIQIKIFRQEKDIIFKIMDNGRGMSRDQIEQLLSEVTKKDKAGFRRVGFANVLNRIHLIYGEQYGGTIYSLEDMFTCVELRLPGEGEKDAAVGFDS
nr:histidine kinase [uncultured Eisenbergiella sp.]